MLQLPAVEFDTGPDRLRMKSGQEAQQSPLLHPSQNPLAPRRARMRAYPQLVEKNMKASALKGVGQSFTEPLDQSSPSEPKVDELQANPLDLMRLQVGIKPLRLCVWIISSRALQKQDSIPRLAVRVSIILTFVPGREVTCDSMLGESIA
ncbi:MAG: hypothetical protein ABI946_02040 [Chthoniobacterales bacterium]